MRKIQLFLLAIGLIFAVAACTNPESKADTWSEEQKAEWTTKCLEMFKTIGEDKGLAEDKCDCMLKKTSEKYTPEEAINITEEEEAKLWQECDYQF